MRFTILVVLVLLVGCSADPFPEYDVLPRSGLRYRVLSFDETGVSPRDRDMVRFRIKMYRGDSLWWTTDRVQVISCDTGAEGLRADLDRFHAGDSLSVLMRADEVWQEFGFKDSDDSGMTDLHLKILDVVPHDRWVLDSDLDREEKAAREEREIQSFLDSCAYAQEFELVQGLYLRKVVSVEKQDEQANRDVKVNYVGYLMDGTLIDDRSAPEAALLYARGMQGQLIPGLERVVNQLRVGERSEVIIPSASAFGERGSVGGIVPPWRAVRFVVWLSSVS